MQMTDENMIYSAQIKGYHKNPNYIKNNQFIPLNKVKSDLFIEIFQDDFIKIIKSIERKKEAKTN